MYIPQSWVLLKHQINVNTSVFKKHFTLSWNCPTFQILRKSVLLRIKGKMKHKCVKLNSFLKRKMAAYLRQQLTRKSANQRPSSPWAYLTKRILQIVPKNGLLYVQVVYKYFVNFTSEIYNFSNKFTSAFECSYKCSICLTVILTAIWWI